ncbi:acyl carrier protein [Providencia alcalifaciens]|uniref:acyl carrier protein n=1 Tax=Providencia alcalifaciens TaxID=126385 RepID=UPI0032DB18BB
MKKIIIEKFNEALEQTNVNKQFQDIEDNMVLLDSGLDSLGFAILVALLEEELGYDPFQIMEDAIYPKTFIEFVNIYETHRA